jgi:ElaB/YqjD/DUF883 family membrane-anchored ribosome-binding protein
MATKSTKSGSAGSEERSPEQIEGEIEVTREEMGETVAELADKTDAKKQAKRKVAEMKAKAAAKKDEVQQKVSAQKETVTEKVKESSPVTTEEAAETTRSVALQARAAARENPVQAAAVAAFAGGLLLGWMLARR